MMFKKIQLSILLSLSVIIVAAQSAEKQTMYSFTCPSSPQGGEYSSDEEINNYILPTSPQGGEYSSDEETETKDKGSEIKTETKVSSDNAPYYPPALNFGGNPNIIHPQQFSNPFRAYPPANFYDTSLAPNLSGPIASKINIKEKTIKPYAISICSGIGATDRTLLNSGFQIIASVDMDEKRNETNIENNVDPLNDENKYKVIGGSITDPNTLRTVKNTVENSPAQCLGNIDLLYTFVAGGKGVDEPGIFESIFDLIGLKMGHEKNIMEPNKDLPKLIYFEVLKYTKLNKKEFINTFDNYSNSTGYYNFIRKSFNFSDYGLPVKNFRNYFVFVRNDLCRDNDLSILWPKSSRLKGDIFQALNITLPNSPYAKTVTWWKEEKPNGQNIPLHTMHFNEECLKIQSDFIKKIPGTGKTKGKLSNVPGFEVKKKSDGKKITDREGDIWRRGLTDQFKTITQSDVQPLIAIHPTQSRSFTLLELSILQGMHTLGNFNLFSKEEMQNPKIIKPQDILARISTTTPPLFLRQIYAQIKEFLTIESEPLPMDLSQLCPYFYNAPVNLYGEGGDKTWQKVRSEYKKNQLAPKNQNASFQTDINFLSAGVNHTPPNHEINTRQPSQAQMNTGVFGLHGNPNKRPSHPGGELDRPLKKVHISPTIIRTGQPHPNQNAGFRNITPHPYSQTNGRMVNPPVINPNSSGWTAELPMVQNTICSPSHLMGRRPNFLIPPQSLIQETFNHNPLNAPLFMNTPPVQQTSINGVFGGQMNPPPPAYLPALGQNTIHSDKESSMILDLTNDDN